MDQLSNYELLDLLATYSTASGEHFMNFMTIFSAYLVAGYLVAGRLHRAALIALSVLYAAVVLVIALGNYATLATAHDVAKEISARSVALGPNVSVAAQLLTATPAGLMQYSNAVLQFLGCVGSMIFVFGRHRDFAPRVAP
jgi:hypothetical protein